MNYSWALLQHAKSRHLAFKACHRAAWCLPGSSCSGALLWERGVLALSAGRWGANRKKKKKKKVGAWQLVLSYQKEERRGHLCLGCSSAWLFSPPGVWHSGGYGATRCSQLSLGLCHVQMSTGQPGWQRKVQIDT